MAKKPKVRSTKGAARSRKGFPWKGPWGVILLVVGVLLLAEILWVTFGKGSSSAGSQGAGQGKSGASFKIDGFSTLRATAGWSRDGSNQPVKGKAIGDGPLRVHGKHFKDGIGTHADSEIVFDLGGRASRFTCQVGADEGGGSSDRVIFRVLADGKELFKSPVMTVEMDALPVDLDLTGVKELLLKVEYDAGSNSWGHANWLDPKFFKGSAPARP